MQWIFRALRGLLLGVLLLLCAALLYVLVIMGDTSPNESAQEPISTAAPLSSMPQPSLRFEAENLYQAAYYFNAPLLTLSSASGYRLQGVSVEETKPKGVDAAVREVRLHYANPDTGRAVYVSSLTPARYLRTLPDRGFLAMADQDMTLAGLRAVSMESGDTLHVHAQQGDTIYQIEGELSPEEMRKCAAATEIAAVNP